MGIPKLTAFIDKHFTGWQRKELKDHLVIDGNNIRNKLNRSDWSHGGQFREYREHVLRFYENLQKSGVVPIVVLDGIDYTGQKWPATIKRSKERVRRVHKELSRAERKPAVFNPSIFPTLGSEVYIQALMYLGIEYVVVDDEADSALVEIANYYSCPVLSSDSDFYVCNLKGGFVHWDRMNMRTHPIHVAAEVYYYQAFCEQFKFKDESVRLILPVLMGNDFWSTRPFISGAPNDGDHALLPYVQFASLFDSLDSYVDTEISRFPDFTKTKLTERCQKSTEMYHRSREFGIQDILDVTDLRTSKGDPIPLWALRNYRKGQLSKLSFSMLVTKRFAFNMFIDDTARESCVVTSMPIRKYTYGILGCDCVTEHFRVEQQISSEDVHSFEAVNGTPLPSLCDLPKLSKFEREALLYHVLSCDESTFQALDGHWKLVLAATAFWHRTAQPPLHLVKSLLLCFLICSGHSAKLRREFTATCTTEFRNSQEWMSNLHCFAQWQSCYDDTISLDKVLMCPLPITCPSLLYDGRLVMYFAMHRDFDYLIHANHQLFRDFLGVILSD